MKRIPKPLLYGNEGANALPVNHYRIITQYLIRLRPQAETTDLRHMVEHLEAHPGAAK